MHRLKKSTLLANTPNTLSITISGSGNLDQINTIPIDSPKTISIYKSSAQTTINPISKEPERLIDYIIVSETDGLITIPTISFSYFSPTAQSYQTIETGPIQFDVLPNESSSISAINAAQTKPIESVLRPYKLVTSPPQWPKLLIIGLSTLQLSQLGVMFCYLATTKARSQLQKKTRSKAAYELAIKTLSTSSTITDYSKLLYEFLENSTTLKLAGNTYPELKERLSSELSSNSIEQIIQTLKHLDEIQFTEKKIN